jgi:hypothetical protein
MDVPLIVLMAVLPVYHDEVIPTPGANQSMQAP